MVNRGRMRLNRLIHGGFAVACCGLLVACGTPAQPARSDTEVTPKTSATLSQPPPSPSAPSRSADWFEARGPVLSVKDSDYPHSVQIADAWLSPDAPQSPAPQGLTHIQFLLKVTSTPGRPMKAPHPKAYWIVRYDGCKAAQNADSQISCSGMDGGSGYFTAEQLRARDYSTGIHMSFGDLEADTPYWIRAWQLVPEKADLARARLCEGVRKGAPSNCIPLGKVRKDA